MAAGRTASWEAGPGIQTRDDEYGDGEKYPGGRNQRPRSLDVGGGEKEPRRTSRIPAWCCHHSWERKHRMRR